MKSLFEDTDMGAPMPKLLVRYGELGLKSASVRRRFEMMLMQDIRRKHMLAKVPCVITSTRGRMFVDSDDWRRSMELLSRTFGVVSFSPVVEVSSGLEELKKSTLEFSSPLISRDATFAIRTRRTGNHPYTSQTLAEKLGEVVLEAHRDRGLKVALDDPDIEIFVEVREKTAYLFSAALPGPGGMPKATQGRILSLVEDDRGAASSWLMMKRGCNVIPATADVALVGALRSWDPDLKPAHPETDLFALARCHDCAGIALSWGLDELSEKTPLKGDLPVFYPLIGMTKDEVGALRERIGR